jgi:hypothetical protein
VPDIFTRVVFGAGVIVAGVVVDVETVTDPVPFWQARAAGPQPDRRIALLTDRKRPARPDTPFVLAVVYGQDARIHHAQRVA